MPKVIGSMLKGGNAVMVAASCTPRASINRAINAHALSSKSKIQGLGSLAPLSLSRKATPYTRSSTKPITVAQAASSNPTINAASSTGTPQATPIKVTAYVFGWYAFNIIFNILNKSTLNLFPAPWFIATFQLIASAAFMCALWVTGLQPKPKVSFNLIKVLLPVAFFHTVGHVSACVSFSQMAVSFTHVVKAAEPVMSVVLTQIILGETYPYYVWLSLLPIIAGCSLAAMKEVSFSWAGFNNAMISNIGMVLRNIYSKKFLTDFKEIDGINLFALLSIISIFYCAPMAVAAEGFVNGAWQWGGLWQAAVDKVGVQAFWKLLGASGLFYHLYNQASYMVLDQGISPVTFSVGNTMKRVAVVVSSVIFFKNPVSALNWIGSMIALLGTGLYSAAKQKASAEGKK